MKELTLIITDIVEKKIPCYFISPHLDDAVLSAGGLIASLAKHTDVTVATVCTRASERPYTLSTKAFLKQCGYTDGDTLYTDRRAEDKQLLHSNGVRTVHLGHVDGAWRKKTFVSGLTRFLGRILPEFIHRYPTHRFHIANGRVHAEDRETVDTLKEQLMGLVGFGRQYYVFCPVALGSHVDHIITQKVCADTFPENLVFWSDFPYNTEPISQSELTKSGLVLAGVWNNNLETKAELIRGYKTQMKLMFPDGHIPVIPELFYLREHDKE